MDINTSHHFDHHKIIIKIEMTVYAPLSDIAQQSPPQYMHARTHTLIVDRT